MKGINSNQFIGIISSYVSLRVYMNLIENCSTAILSGQVRAKYITLSGKALIFLLAITLINIIASGQVFAQSSDLTKGITAQAKKQNPYASGYLGILDSEGLINQLGPSGSESILCMNGERYKVAERPTLSTIPHEGKEWKGTGKNCIPCDRMMRPKSWGIAYYKGREYDCQKEETESSEDETKSTSEESKSAPKETKTSLEEYQFGDKQDSKSTPKNNQFENSTATSVKSHEEISQALPKEFLFEDIQDSKTNAEANITNKTVTDTTDKTNSETATKTATKTATDTTTNAAKGSSLATVGKVAGAIGGVASAGAGVYYLGKVIGGW